MLVLSLFPGVGGFCRGFTKAGFTVARGPDLITGEDGRDFRGVPGRFDGVIGGSPCQDFSGLNRNKGENSLAMLGEFIRVVTECDVDWFLHENVIGVPEFEVDGYVIQRFILDLAWFKPASRKRVFTWGHREGVLLNPMVGKAGQDLARCAETGDERPFETLRDIQGFEPELMLTGFTEAGKRKLMGNSVSPIMSEYIASHIMDRVYNNPVMAGFYLNEARRCGCGCGREIQGRGNRRYASDACKLRAFRKRQAA